MKKVYIIIAIIALLTGILSIINKDYLASIGMICIIICELNAYHILVYPKFTW